MKIAYFDCFAGISGDMTLGALIDAGADPEVLRESLKKIHLHGYKLVVSKKNTGHMAATDVDVILEDHDHHHRHLGHILELINKSELSDWVKEKASAVFTRLAESEAKVHGTTVEKVHFHEVGAVDAIVDIVGSMICLEQLGCPKIIASPMPTFHGYAKGSHGTFPLPAPATADLLKDVPWRELGIEGELVTPTGAAIITTLASEFGPMPAMTVETIGSGSGKKDFGIANLLRVMVGHVAHSEHPAHKVTVIETNIDDMNPQFYDSVMQKLFDAGALDVYFTPIQMKKNRPGTLLSAICPPDKTETMSMIVLSQTSALGVRVSDMDRICVQRRWEEVETPYGTIRIKIGEVHGKVTNAAPEYEDCRKAAEEHSVPVKLVYDAAVASHTS